MTIDAGARALAAKRQRRMAPAHGMAVVGGGEGGEGGDGSEEEGDGNQHGEWGGQGDVTMAATASTSGAHMLSPLSPAMFAVRILDLTFFATLAQNFIF